MKSKNTRKVYIPEVMKPNFLCNFSQLLLPNVILFTLSFTADVGFLPAFWLWIFVQLDVDIITTILSLIHGDSYLKSVRA